MEQHSSDHGSIARHIHSLPEEERWQYVHRKIYQRKLHGIVNELNTAAMSTDDARRKEAISALSRIGFLLS